MLSIRGNDFIAHWAYEERISAHAQPAVKWEQFLHVQSMLSIRGTNFIACWAYVEPISSHAEHARKCLKVEYLCQFEYDFFKISCYRPLGPYGFGFCKKSIKKISCLCTFKEFKNRFRFKGINSASICTSTTTMAMERGDRFEGINSVELMPGVLKILKIRPQAFSPFTHLYVLRRTLVAKAEMYCGKDQAA